MRVFGHRMSFKHLLTGIIFCIVIVVVLAGIWISYASASDNLRKNADRLRTMTEDHVDTSFRMIDTGLKLYDNTYNEDMQEAFPVAMEEYNRSGGDPSRMDLEATKTTIGGMDIHVINDRCAIEYSTVPADLGLDFAVIYPDFCEYLHGIRNTSGFYPDRVVMEWHTGTLTKYSYMPTPDHRYILELAMRSEHFSQERMDLRYSDVVDEVRTFNPYLEEVLLFQKQKRLLYNTSYVPTDEESAMLDYLLWENRSTQVIRDAKSGRTVVWEVVDLRDPDYAADMSIFAKLTYNDALLTTQLNRLATLHVLAALLVFVTGGLLAITVSRRLSRPIEQLVEDVDHIARGDIDHAIRPLSGYELSRLSGSIQVMVDRLKEQIRECEINEKRFMDLVQFLPQGVFEADSAGTITYANPAALELFGYTAEDHWQGKHILDVLAPEDRARAREAFMAVLQGEAHEGTEYTGIRKDGSTFPILTFNNARIIDGGTVLGTRGTIVDITRIKGIEREIRQLNVELESQVAQRTSDLKEANREMEAFTYSVSHDLRSPLRAIDGYSALLLEKAGDRLGEGERHHLEVIRYNVQQMDRLIDGLLSLSRMGRAELKREWVSPGPLVQEIAAEFLPHLEGRGEMQVGALPPCYADAVMLRQVYTNLISNAVKFTRHVEHPRIEIGSSTEGESVVYFVRDNGTGFDMQYADKLFQPFQRLHKATEFEGTGIGLTIVSRIIRRHDGRIWAESTPGQGATFSFTIGTPPG
jgi:PAS domain S-box-containing protein